jgi:hypothetical protein
MQFARTTDENLAIAPLVRWLDGVRTARLSIRITAASANGCAAGKPATSVGAADAYHDHASPPRIESAVQPLLYVLLASAVLTGQVGRFSIRRTFRRLSARTLVPTRGQPRCPLERYNARNGSAGC